MVACKLTGCEKSNPHGKFVAWTVQAGYMPGVRRVQVDSATWGIILPQAYVEKIYKSIDPAPYEVKDLGWVADCNVRVNIKRKKWLPGANTASRQIMQVRASGLGVSIFSLTVRLL